MGDGNSAPVAARSTPSEEDYGSWTWKQKLEDLIGCDPSRNIMPKHPDSAKSLNDMLQVSHEEIVEHVSSILTSNGIAYSGKGIDTGKLECYQQWAMLIDRSGSQSGDCEKTNEADKSSFLEDEISKRILLKQPPKGVAIKEVRNMFFPYWKSVLSRRFPLKITPTCQPSRKDLLSAETRKKGKNNSMGNLASTGWPQFASNYESRRMLCAVASMSRKVLFKRA